MARDKTLDSVKGVLICFVIILHLFSLYGNHDCVQYSIMKFLHIFVMPLFVMLSGMLNNKEKNIYENIKSIIETFIVYQVLYLLIQYIWGTELHWQDIITPCWALWFLFSLVCWRIIIKIIPESWLTNIGIIFPITIILSIFSGYILHGRLFSIQRTISFFPFFLYGYYIRKGMMINFVNKNYLAWIIILICLGLSVLYPDAETLLLLERGADHYEGELFIHKALLLPLSFILSLSVWRIVQYNYILSEIGKNSLSFYIYHIFIIMFVFLPIAHHFEFSRMTHAIVIYWIIIITYIYGWNRFKLSRILLNPISFIKTII